MQEVRGGLTFNRKETYMSRNTVKLGLKIPLYTDEIETTILELGQNFEKIDLISDDFVTTVPTYGDYLQNKVFKNSNCTNGSYIGWVNTRTGKCTPKWQPIKSYVNGDYVIPALDNGHFYTCIQTGYSGFTEPIFPVSMGTEVTDIRKGNTWLPTTLHQLNDIVLPTIDNGRFYICIQAGETGNTEPSWQQVDGATTYDKNAVWHGYRIAKWKESGSAALFRPYGKIE